MANKNQELKQLNTRLGRCRARIGELNGQITDLNRQRSAEKAAEAGLVSKIEVLQRHGAGKALIISEHAMLRYIERVIGLDMEDIREAVLPVDTRERVRLLGNATVPVNGHSVKITNGTVVTVLMNGAKDG